MASKTENDARALARVHEQQQGDSSPSTAASSDSEDDDDDPQQQQQQQQQNDREWDEWDDDNDDGNDDDDDGEGDSDRTRALFDPPSAPPLPSPEAALARDRETHGFDLRAWRRRCGLDQYGVIRAVNWARRAVARGEDPRPALRAYEEAVVGSSGSGAAAAPPPAPPAWAGDEFLVPAVPNDPLVTYDYEEDEEDGGEREEEGAAKAAVAGAATASAAAASLAEAAAASSSAAHQQQQQLLIQRLEAENAALRTRLQALVEATLSEELRSESALVERCGGAGPSSSSPSAAAAAAAAAQPPPSAAALIDAAYFDSYSHFDIHREMLSDAPRTESYRDALERNPSLTKGKAVVDVGAGTGVLSLFAARGGKAAAVVGIEGSARMARIARAVAAANGLAREQGGPVAIVSGRVEALVEASKGGGGKKGSSSSSSSDAPAAADPAALALLPAPNSADVLVSEWMGYALLFESMLSSVLTARDAWLKPGGAVLPDVARVLVAGGDLRAALGCGFWDRVHGLRMTPIGDEVVQGVVGYGVGTGAGGADGEEAKGEGERQQQRLQRQRQRPPRLLVRQVPASALLTASAQVRELDLATMSHDDQDFTAEFECALLPPAAAAAAAASGAAAVGAAAGPPMGASATPSTSPATTTTTTTISCLVLWFDTLFTERFCRDHPVVLSTAPTADPTHWAQAVLPLSRPVELPSSSGSGSRSLRGRLSMARRRGRHRALDISLEYWPAGGASSSSAPVVDLYSMGVHQDEEQLELEGEGGEGEGHGAARAAAAAAAEGLAGLAVGSPGPRPEATIA